MTNPTGTREDHPYFTNEYHGNQANEKNWVSGPAAKSVHPNASLDKHWISGSSSYFTDERHENKVGDNGWVSEVSATEPSPNTPPDKHWNSGGSSYFTNEYHGNQADKKNWVSGPAAKSVHPNASPDKHWVSGGSSYFTEERHENKVGDDGRVSEATSQSLPAKHWQSEGSSLYTDEHHPNQPFENAWRSRNETDWPVQKTPLAEAKSWSNAQSNNSVPLQPDNNVSVQPNNSVPVHGNAGEWSMSMIDVEGHAPYTQHDDAQSNRWHREPQGMYDDDAGHKNVAPVHWTEESAGTAPSHKNVGEFSSEMIDMTADEKATYGHLDTTLDAELSSLTPHLDATNGWQAIDESHHNGMWQTETSKPPLTQWQTAGMSNPSSHGNMAEWQSEEPSNVESHHDAGGWVTSDQSQIPGTPSSRLQGNDGWKTETIQADNDHRYGTPGPNGGSISSTGGTSSSTDSSSNGHDNFVDNW